MAVVASVPKVWALRMQLSCPPIHPTTHLPLSLSKCIHALVRWTNLRLAASEQIASSWDLLLIFLGPRKICIRSNALSLKVHRFTGWEEVKISIFWFSGGYETSNTNLLQQISRQASEKRSTWKRKAISWCQCTVNPCVYMWMNGTRGDGVGSSECGGGSQLPTVSPSASGTG